MDKHDLRKRYPKQYLLKNISVYIGVAGYVLMLASGSVLIGAWSKMFAELLRFPFYRVTQANDMAALSLFFITASAAIIIPSFF